MATVTSRVMTFREWLITKIMEETDKYTLEQLEGMDTDDLAWLRDCSYNE